MNDKVESLKKICLPFLYRVYEMGKKLEPLSDMESEFDLPCIDLDISLKLAQAVSTHYEGVIKEKDAEIKEIGDLSDRKGE